MIVVITLFVLVPLTIFVLATYGGTGDSGVDTGGIETAP